MFIEYFSPLKHKLLLFYIAVLYGVSFAKWRRNSWDSDDCRFDLQVLNDGPVTFDVPITFNVSLACANDDETYLYIFEDDAHTQHIYRTFSNKTASATFVYRETTHSPETYIMRISSYLVPLYVRVALREVKFHVTKYIPGKLQLLGAMKRHKKYVASGQDINITLDLYFPKKVYDAAEFSYSWILNNNQFTTINPYIPYSFTTPGVRSIVAAAVARIPAYDDIGNEQQSIKYKWGYFNDEVVVKDPFYTITLMGNTYLQHGQLLDMDVSCNGSGPVDYCWTILEPSVNHENFTCNNYITVGKCSFPIIYYFQESGDYVVGISVNNVVSFVQRTFEVHVYDVSSRSQLSTVLIPLICTVLVVLIIVAAIVIHIRRHQRYDIETADFDFLQTDSCVPVETSWERMYHSFLGLLCLRRLSARYLRAMNSTTSGETLNNYGSFKDGIQEKNNLASK